jgi:hypothetical protein
MIDVINFIPITSTSINSSTLNYMNNCKLTVCPEDVYFSKNIQDFNLGLIADWDSASKFSTETIYNSNSLGGHNFWLSDNLWEKRVYNQAIITFKLYKNIKTEHRGGWNTIKESLYKNNIINEVSSYMFLDVIEKYFLWDKEKVINKPWTGVIHCTPETPPYLNNINISFLFTNKNFIESLDNCYCIFTLSNYITRYLNDELLKINKSINIFTLKHPIDTTDIKLFELQNYLINPCKKLVQIGQQLRRCTSIYLLNNIKHQRIWLTGTKRLLHCNKLLEQETSYLSINIPNSTRNTVNMYYTKTFEEYDVILSNNIVFVDLFDASANNVVLECIIRNTPIIIRKLEAIVEYLGEDYPLYFTELDQVNNLLEFDNIKKAHEYLKNMDKMDISMNYFIKSMINNLMSLRI